MTKGMNGIINICTTLLAKSDPNEGNNNAQAPNQVTQDTIPSQGIDPNLDNSGIRDATASTSRSREILRTRNCNTRTVPGQRKYSTIRKSTRKGEILETTLYRVILTELDNYKQVDGKYNGISRMITPDLLKSCYSLIKSNPGNMTQGSTKETLDRINEN